MSTNSTEYATIKCTEAETLATFQQEIPSQYFSHLSEKDYTRHIENATYLYRDILKFPPKMFDRAELIDFGAGTGENTIFFANWGATCTLVEFNDKAHNISRGVFSKYARNADRHKFVCSSIFDYSPNDQMKYDIVHCRGVLSHTAANRTAFKKLSTFVKPGGFLIYSDPNKAGGFQNMLERFAVYQFASTPEDMVGVCEALFKEDIDRSQKAVPRTRRAIIFDRWVIQCQDDPSVSDVACWVQENGLRLYSCHPPVLLPFFGDSLNHKPKLDPYSLHELFSVAELGWMMQTDSDAESLPAVTAQLSDFASSLSRITSHVANFSMNKELVESEFSRLTRALVYSFYKVDILSPLRNKLSVFASEAEEFVSVVKEGRLDKVREFIEKTKYLFKGACGMRLGVFVAYRPDQSQ